MNLIWMLILILVVLWLIGFVGAGIKGLIHILLVIALLVFVFDLITRGRR